MSKSINEVEIVKLEFPHNVRTRMGMFGCDGTNADILFREIVDNTVDLTLKFRQPIKVKAITNISDNEGKLWNYVEDNGIGMPLYLDKDFPELDQPILIDMMRKINVGSNFNKTEYSLGMNGVGNKLTEAISENFFFVVNSSKKDFKTLPKSIQSEINLGNTYFIFKAKFGEFQYYKMLNRSNMIDHFSDFLPKKLIQSLENLPDDFGTVCIFQPDGTLLDSTRVNYHGYPFKLINSLFKFDSDLSNIKTEFTLNDKQIEPYSFIQDFNEPLLENKTFTQSVSIKTEDNQPIKFIYEIAYSKDKFNFDFDGSVNLLKTPVGKHITLVQQAIGLAFNKFNKLITVNDSKLGQRLFVLNLAVNPLFNSQDKTKLSKYEDRGYDEKKVIKALSDSFLNLMEENAEYFNILCQRIIEYKKATDKLSNIELLKSKFILGDEGDKRRAMSGEMSDVYDCSSTDKTKTELYIVEGKSAGSGLLKNRNKLYQAIIPIRGKLANTSEFDEERLADNKEVLAIINAIGCGIGGICDASKSRYGKVIIGVDLDPDGQHIANLITTLFYQHAPDLIKQGYLYKLEAPFYLVEDGKTKKYYYANEKSKVDFSKKVTKLKGLGSYDDEETRKYLLDPKTRKLTKVVWNDEFQLEMEEASKLMYSGIARKNLMIDCGVFVKGNIL